MIPFVLVYGYTNTDTMRKQLLRARRHFVHSDNARCLNRRMNNRSRQTKLCQKLSRGKRASPLFVRAQAQYCTILEERDHSGQCTTHPAQGSTVATALFPEGSGRMLRGREDLGGQQVSTSSITSQAVSSRSRRLFRRSTQQQHHRRLNRATTEVHSRAVRWVGKERSCARSSALYLTGDRSSFPV